MGLSRSSHGLHRPDTLAYATGHARQVNVLGDNYAPVYFTSAPTPTRSLRQLPHGPQDFSGRTGDISAVQHKAGGDDGTGPYIIDVYGAPGVGKSALAVHVAHRLTGRFDEVQLYADLGEQNGEVPTASQILQRFVADLDPATIGVPVGAANLPQRYRSLLAGRRCLILLDNAQSADQVEALIPSSTMALVLVTSRAPLSAIEGVSLHHLNLMSEDESLALLAEVSQRHWCGTEEESAARILVHQCGRLPLALRIAGAILKKKRHWSLDKLVGVFTDERTRLAKLVAGSLDVRSSFEVSYGGLGETEAHAFRVLSLLPLSRFEARHAGVFLQLPAAQAEELLEVLVDAQLVDTDDGIHFRYHDLLKLFAQEHCKSVGDDPEGFRVARFLEVYTSDFLESYRTRLVNSQWSGADPTAFPRHDRRISAPDELYVPQRLTQAEGTLFGTRHAPWQEVLAEHRKVLVLGGAGTGKTVLADRICYEVAAGLDGGQLDVAVTAPLRQRSGRPQRLERLVADSVRLRHDLEMPHETLELLLTERRTLIVFDGLDELPVPERDRAQVDVARFCRAYPQARVLVLSRPGASVSSLIASGFAAHVIDRFSHSDVRAYLSKWATATRMDHGEAQMLATVITSMLEGADWLSTPLLVAQAAVVYLHDRSLPRRVIDLYERTYRLLFEGRDVQRGIARSYLPTHLIGPVVCCLAYKFVTQPGGTVDMPSDEFRAAVREALDAVLEVLPSSVSRSRQLEAADELLALFSGSDFPVRPAPAAPSGAEPSWTLVRDPFGQYLAARYIVDDDIDAVGKRVMKAVRASGFVEGANYVRQLLENRSPSSLAELVTALKDELARESDPQARRPLQYIVDSL